MVAILEQVVRMLVNLANDKYKQEVIEELNPYTAADQKWEVN